MESRERALLGGVEIFGELDERALDEVLRAAHRRRVVKGDTVFRQGEEAQSFYVLVEGRLKVTQVTPEGQQVVVRFMGPGEMFGCVAVFGGRRYPGTATAVEDMRMLGWTKGATQRLMERHPRLAINTLGTVGGRLQESQARVRELSTERVERRIARALLRLAEQAGKPVGSGVRIDFPISRQDVAEMTGTTLHTVSRTLSAWEAQGLWRAAAKRSRSACPTRSPRSPRTDRRRNDKLPAVCARAKTGAAFALISGAAPERVRQCARPSA